MAITGLLPRLMGRERKECAEEAEVRAALQQWKDATRFFESVSDPELMDYAIYDMETARRKYMFLLRKRARSGSKHQ